MCVSLKGSAKTVGTEHWQFHKVLDDFWDVYRYNPTKSVTEKAYSDALIRALDAAGLGDDSLIMAEAAIEQAKHFGYFLGKKKPKIKIPRRTTRRTR